MTTAASARDYMIDCQLRPNEVNDERIIDAISAVPREQFVPKSKRGIAYVDEDICVGNDRYLLEPVTFARMIVAAETGENDLILDIGCATGYSAAVLAQLCGTVVALEVDEDLYKTAEKTLADMEVMNAAVVKGKHQDGVAKQGAFDVIFMNGAVSDIPAKLLKQLAVGGRLVCVKTIGGVGRATRIRKTEDGIEEQVLFDAHVKDLPGFSRPAGFVF